jgi:hypothetical protein
MKNISGSIVFSFGKWGGFYVFKGKTSARLCFGFCAITYFYWDIDNVLAEWMRFKDAANRQLIMNIINESGSVQAIARDGGYDFFVECDIEDDIHLIFIDDIDENQAKTYAILMSHAWDVAQSKIENNGF